MNKKEALICVLNDGVVYCKDTNDVIGFCRAGFYSMGGAEDGGDKPLELQTLPYDATYILIDS